MTDVRTDMKCTVCRKHRANLRTRKSKLLPNAQMMFLCTACFEGKYEPRFAVILVARDTKNNGMERARDYIRQHRYYGDKITADELL